MNKDQFARLARHRKVQQALVNYALAVAAVPAFARLAAEYLRQLGLLAGTAHRTGAPAEGATLAKSAAGTALVARLVKAANALYLVYKAETPANLAEAAKMHRRASDYTNMGDQALATEAADLAQRVAAHAVVLKKDYNWDAAALAALAAESEAFAAQLTAPQLAIDAAKIKGATAKSTLSTLNVFLRDDLRAGMELLKDSHPEAYRALREASQVDDARRGKGDKAGTVKLTQLEQVGFNVNAWLRKAVGGEKALIPDAALLLQDAAAAVEPPHPIDLTAPASTPVKVYGTTSDNAIVTKASDGQPAMPAGLSPTYHWVADAPCEIIYTFTFLSRPWSIELGAMAGTSTQVYALNSAAAGLPAAGLGQPDTLHLVLTVHA